MVQQDAEIAINQEFDRIYSQLQSSHLTVGDVVLYRNNLSHAVVWNPWIEWSKRTADMHDAGYKEFVCVEYGVLDKTTLEVGASFDCFQELIAV